ncbi:palmitoyl-acyl carrier protein thioesterase, chloroplastic-like [Andrographis paniculata]|uniref:palmitoyl-acyl carrier protein thioesterase, chloroplastic-like n=1 Tax=Andrographis paniculata TaxID=175694 RepID=UPI0021E79088|nr:palmitoyl-acyl carrier protein thioesterase, chloroplastic-like [Andrographis paniculata]
MALMHNNNNAATAFRLGKDCADRKDYFSTFRHVGFPKRSWCVKVMANMKTTAATGNVDMVNGRKVKNGVPLDRIPFLEKRNNNTTQEGELSLQTNHDYLLGKFVEDRLVYRQSFVVRSYEIGPDKTATMETLMNLLQETALNHVASAGVAGNGFGATREMSARKLIWVVTRIHVQIEKYSSWGDMVEIDTWVDAAGKNGMRRDWIIRDYATQNIITRATSTWVIMNRETRRLSKIPEEVKKEVEPFYLNRAAITTENTDSDRIEKLTDETAQRIRTDLAPRWSDMDANQHVNNVKYIGWLLESVPINVLEDYNLTRMTLEYRRECRLSNVLQSLTSIKPKVAKDGDNQEGDGATRCNEEIRVGNKDDFECTHLLRMEANHTEIVRARSVWQPKKESDNKIP